MADEQPLKPKRKYVRTKPARSGYGWKPTDEEREKIKHWVATGYTQKQIADQFGKSVDTLQNICRHELDHGKMEVNSRISAKIYEEAMKGNATLLIYWSKVHMGWIDKPELAKSESALTINVIGGLPADDPQPKQIKSDGPV